MHKYVETNLNASIEMIKHHSDNKQTLQTDIQGVPKKLLESGEQYIVVSPFSFVFSGCLTTRVINAARIVLFKFYN